MLKLKKLQCFKILLVYTFLSLATIFCYNAKRILSPARKRPFLCSDKSLAKPFVYDTVPPKQLYLIGVYFPIVLILICELVATWETQLAKKRSLTVLRYILRTVIMLTLFFIGLAVERLYKSVAKIKMARLRPNFITVCQPVDSKGFKCLSLEKPDVMSDYECSSTLYPAWAVSSAFSSFPSGHTSLTAYAMMFLICYLSLLNWRLKRLQSFSTLVILIMQVLCFLIILFVATSRVLDFRHHWSDVVAGFIGGSLIALAVNYYLRNQLDNMEQWLTEATEAEAVVDIETVDACFANKSINDKEGKCAMELVNE